MRGAKCLGAKFLGPKKVTGGKRTSILRDEATLKFKLNQCQVPSIAHGRLFSLFFKNNFINLIVVYIFCYNQGCQISIDFDNQKPAFLKDCERFHKDKLQRCETKLKESDRNKKIELRCHFKKSQQAVFFRSEFLKFYYCLTANIYSGLWGVHTMDSIGLLCTIYRKGL